MKKYEVRLKEGERKELKGIIKKGHEPAYKIMHANVLLKADAQGPGWVDRQIAESFGVCLNSSNNSSRMTNLLSSLLRSRPFTLNSGHYLFAISRIRFSLF